MGLFAVDGEKFPRRQSTRCLGSGAHQLFSSGSSLLSIDLQCGVRHSQRRKLSSHLGLLNNTGDVRGFTNIGVATVF
jgi:hypothetical protein